MENNRKKFIIDFNKSQDFHLFKEKVLNQDSNKQDSTKQHSSLIYSKDKTHRLYKEIISTIPRWKGAVIIYGENTDTLKPIDCLYSQNNLKENFIKGLKTSINGSKIGRFAWMEELLLSRKFKRLKVFTTTSF